MEEELAKSGEKRSLAIDLAESAETAEFGDDFGEVFHVRPDDDRASGEDRFDGVLSSDALETLPHDNEIGEGIPAAELAGGVGDPNAHRGVSVPGRRRGGPGAGPEDGIEAVAAKLGGDSGASFGVPRNDDKFEFGKFAP
jgi:hypothetical protein